MRFPDRAQPPNPIWRPHGGRAQDGPKPVLQASSNESTGLGGLPSLLERKRNGEVAPEAGHRPAAPPLRIGEKIAFYDGSFPVPIFSAASRTQRLKERHRSQ
jgi:hypothetical protein